MKRLLNPRDKKDIKMFRECLDNILLSPPPSYSAEGLTGTFDWFVRKFTNPDEYPHFHIAAEIIKNKITRFHLGYSMSTVWGKSNLTLPIWIVGFIYNAPGSVHDPRDHELGHLVTDKFAELGMYTWYTLLPLPKKVKDINGYSDRVMNSTTLVRITGFIDQVIDSKEKLEKLRTDFIGFGQVGFIPPNYVRPLMLVMHNLRPNFRNTNG
jgi:hypothetical protein